MDRKRQSCMDSANHPAELHAVVDDFTHLY